MTGTGAHVDGALLLYHRPMLSDASTINEHIDAFERYSRFPFWKLNTDLGFPRGLAGLDFDVIVAHYSVFASGPYDYLLDESFLAYLEGSDAYKVAFFQDEHQYCRRRFEFLDRYGFDCVYTCVAPRYFAETYGRYTEVPKLVNHVPAYVSPDMVATAERVGVPDSGREVDVGYRARPVPAYVGRGGLEKVEIGERFAERARDSGLALDIDMSEESRLYGEDWYRFLAGCRGFLGTESGASVIDVEDEVREEYEALLIETGEEPTVERLEQGALGRWDGATPLRTTSSRHFEAAALRVCQILFEGSYSGALKPDQHYIPLRKDFSNLDAVIERFRDPEQRRELTENAHRDLIASGEHSYERFFAGFDATLREAGLSPPETAPERELVPRALGRQPARQVAVHYVDGVWQWLRRNHPRVWRVLHLASRPLVVPIRGLARLGGGA